MHEWGIRRRLLAVAALAIGLFALAQAAGAATLEFGKCTKVAVGTGLYKNGSCTKLGGEQKFEWTPLKAGEEVKFSIEKKPLSPPLVSETANEHFGSKVLECSGETGEGAITGEKEITKETIGWTGCTPEPGVSCTTSGEPSGEILTNALIGVPGVITKGVKPIKDKDGLTLKGEASEVWDEYDCGPVHGIDRGAMIAPFATNKMFNKLTMVYSREGSTQIPTAFEGQPIEVLEGSVFGEPFESEGQSGEIVVRTVPKTVKVELRDCKPEC